MLLVTIGRIYPLVDIETGVPDLHPSFKKNVKIFFLEQHGAGGGGIDVKSYSLWFGKGRRLRQQHGLQSATLTSYFYKNNY
jgi:hypothetical protein